MELAVRAGRDVIGRTANAYELLRFVVIRSDILVADGPIEAEPVALIGLEIVLGEPE